MNLHHVTKDAPRWAELLVLAEDDRGDYWLPSRNRPGWWNRRYNPRNPFHWPYMAASWLTGWRVAVDL